MSVGFRSAKARFGVLNIVDRRGRVAGRLGVLSRSESRHCRESLTGRAVGSGENWSEVGGCEVSFDRSVRKRRCCGLVPSRG